MELKHSVISGGKLMEQWGISPEGLLLVVINHKLPTLHRESGVEGWVDDDYGEIEDMLLKEKHDISEFYFKTSAVEKIEKEHDKLSNASLKTLTGKELMKRWDKEWGEVIDFIDKKVIRPVDYFGVDAYKTFTYTLTFAGFDVENLFFRFGDIMRAETEYNITAQDESIGLPKKAKLRPNQIHRLECRETAITIWDTYPKLTIPDMCERQEIVKIRKMKTGSGTYAPKTVRRWIRDLCPDRSPGRRPGK